MGGTGGFGLSFLHEMIATMGIAIINKVFFMRHGFKSYASLGWLLKNQREDKSDFCLHVRPRTLAQNKNASRLWREVYLLVLVYLNLVDSETKVRTLKCYVKYRIYY